MRVSILGQVVTEVSCIHFSAEDGRVAITTPDGKVIRLFLDSQQNSNKMIHDAHNELLVSGYTQFSAAYWSVLVSDLDLKLDALPLPSHTTHFGD